MYDVQPFVPEIRVIDAATGVDRSLGPGVSPMLAADGRRFSYLNSSGGLMQVWLGDAVTGAVQWTGVDLPRVNQLRSAVDRSRARPAA